MTLPEQREFIGRDDEGWDIGKTGKTTRRCLLLPAGNEIRSIRLCLLFGFQLRRIVHRWIIGDRDVGNPPSPRLLSSEDGILERRPGRLDRDDRLDQFRPSIGDQPAERPGLRMCQDDRGTNAIEQRGRCMLVEPLGLRVIG